MQENCVFRGHLGLGDHIIQQGMVNRFHRLFDKFFVLCKHHNKASVQHMNKDLANVTVVSVSGDEEANTWVDSFDGEKIMCGHMGANWNLVGQNLDVTKFNEAFYNQLGVKPSEQYNWQPEAMVDADVMNLAPSGDFIFMHDGGSSGEYLIDTDKVNNELPIVKPLINAPTIFHYLPLIKMAKEIHCIDSSFALMIDLCRDITHNLYLHSYARPKEWSPRFTKKWKVIE